VLAAHDRVDPGLLGLDSHGDEPVEVAWGNEGVLLGEYEHQPDPGDGGHRSILPHPTGVALVLATTQIPMCGTLDGVTLLPLAAPAS
jgi:hypothetical protein